MSATADDFTRTKFQSTLSVRRATDCHHSHNGTTHISIHALRKESDLCGLLDFFILFISIHALRKESDTAGNIIGQLRKISIHALRKESDTTGSHTLTHRKYFNPRSP